MACRIIEDEKSGTKVPRKERKNALTERRKDSELMLGAGNEENQHLMLEQTTKNGRQSRVQIKFGRNGRSSRIVSRTMNDALSGKWHLPVIRRRKRGISDSPRLADTRGGNAECCGLPAKVQLFSEIRKFFRHVRKRAGTKNYFFCTTCL